LPSRPGAGGGGEQLPGRGGDGGRGDGGRGDGGRGDGGRGDDRPSRPGQGGSGEQWRPGDNRPGNLPANRPGGDWWSQNHADRINNWNDWQDNRHNNWTNINNNWGNRWANNWNGCNHWFDGNWWNNHPCDHWNWPGGANWWGWAGWGALSSWIPWGWNQPVYYNYGDNVYYQDDMVYYGDQPVCSADEYTLQAQSIAQSIPPDIQPAADDWMPLGVFALTQDGQSANDEPTMFLQLAVSKQGIIAGTFQNTATGVVKSVEGMVDKETQRAAWTAEDQSRPLMETGLGNLTQDTAGVLVHFDNGDTQRWLMARLKQPQGAAASP